MQCQTDFHKHFSSAFALLNYSLLFTPPLEVNLGKKNLTDPVKTVYLLLQSGMQFTYTSRPKLN